MAKASKQRDKAATPSAWPSRRGDTNGSKSLAEKNTSKRVTEPKSGPRAPSPVAKAACEGMSAKPSKRSSRSRGRSDAAPPSGQRPKPFKLRKASFKGRGFHPSVGERGWEEIHKWAYESDE